MYQSYMTEKHIEQSDSEFHFVYSWTICNKKILQWRYWCDFCWGPLSTNSVLSCLESMICRLYAWFILWWCFYNATTFSVGYVNLISSQLFFSSQWSKLKFCILSQIELRCLPSHTWAEAIFYYSTMSYMLWSTKRAHVWPKTAGRPLPFGRV